MKYYQSTLVTLLFIIIGCNDQKGCYDSTDTLMVASFKVSDFRVFDTLFIKGVGRNGIADTLVYDTLSSQSKRFPLPLSLSEDSTGFVIKAGGFRDTLYMRHSMTMKFLSEYCGFAPEYLIKGSFFTSGIDSVKISDELVNTKSVQKNTNDQNITIYFNFSVH
jgi:hypothetical protein